MASLHNLAIGLYDLQKDKGKTRVSSFTSWMRQMTHVSTQLWQAYLHANYR